MEKTQIQIKTNEEDKTRWKASAKTLSLTLSGFMKLAAAEKSNRILVLRNQNAVCEAENYQDQRDNRRFLEQQGVA